MLACFIGNTARAGFVSDQRCRVSTGAAGHGLALVVQAGRRLVNGETHRRLPANENRAFLRVFVVQIAPHRLRSRGRVESTQSQL